LLFCEVVDEFTFESGIRVANKDRLSATSISSPEWVGDLGRQGSFEISFVSRGSGFMDTVFGRGSASETLRGISELLFCVKFGFVEGISGEVDRIS